MSPLDRYAELRDETTRQAARLFRRYASHVQCRKGCSFCCDEVTVLPIELETVRRWLVSHGPPPRARLARYSRTPEATLPGRPVAMSPGGAPPAIEERDRRSRDRSRYGTFPTLEADKPRCAFLGTEGECTIYDARPIICRTHGLPLAYRVYEYDERGHEIRPDDPEYADLWCDLNFTSLADEDATRWFGRNGRIAMDTLNHTIERLNEEFLGSDEGRRYAGRPPGEERDPLGVLLPPDYGNE